MRIVTDRVKSLNHRGHRDHRDYLGEESELKIYKDRREEQEILIRCPEHGSALIMRIVKDSANSLNHRVPRDHRDSLGEEHELKNAKVADVADHYNFGGCVILKSFWKLRPSVQNHRYSHTDTFFPCRNSALQSGRNHQVPRPARLKRTKYQISC